MRRPRSRRYVRYRRDLRPCLAPRVARHPPWPLPGQAPGLAGRAARYRPLQTTVKEGTGMARKDLFTRLADAGEEAISRLSDAPGSDRLLGAVQSLRERMDEMQKRVRGIDELERRVAELERRPAGAGGGGPAAPPGPFPPPAG